MRTPRSATARTRPSGSDRSRAATAATPAPPRRAARAGPRAASSGQRLTGAGPRAEALVSHEQPAAIDPAFERIQRSGRRALPAAAVGVEQALVAGARETLGLGADEAARVRADRGEGFDGVTTPPQVDDLLLRLATPAVDALADERAALPAFAFDPRGGAEVGPGLLLWITETGAPPEEERRRQREGARERREPGGGGLEQLAAVQAPGL